MDQPKRLGRRVRTVRRAARIAQEKAAEEAGLNSKYLGEIERGEKRPSFEAILAIAKALRVSPAVLFQFDREAEIVLTGYPSGGVVNRGGSCASTALRPELGSRLGSALERILGAK